MPCRAASVDRTGRTKIMFGYSLNYLIDMDHAVIVDVEPTPTRIDKEVRSTETMIERTEQCFNLKPEYLAGDVAYGTGKMLDWLVKRGIDPHVSVWDKGKRVDGTISRDDFTYDKERFPDQAISHRNKTVWYLYDGEHSHRAADIASRIEECGAMKCKTLLPQMSSGNAGQGITPLRTGADNELPLLNDSARDITAVSNRRP